MFPNNDSPSGWGNDRALGSQTDVVLSVERAYALFLLAMDLTMEEEQAVFKLKELFNHESLFGLCGFVQAKFNSAEDIQENIIRLTDLLLQVASGLFLIE